MVTDESGRSRMLSFYKVSLQPLWSSTDVLILVNFLSSLLWYVLLPVCVPGLPCSLLALTRHLPPVSSQAFFRCNTVACKSSLFLGCHSVTDVLVSSLGSGQFFQD